MKIKILIYLSFALFLACYSHVQQNLHWRVPDERLAGKSVKIFLTPVDSVEAFLPEKFEDPDSLILLVHFHGASFVAKHAVYQSPKAAILVNVHLGQGSSTYEKPFLDKNYFPEMIDQLKNEINQKFNKQFLLSHVVLSSFSAGYGAIRTILRSPENLKLIDGIILLDGMHTDYTNKTLSFPQNLNLEKLDMYIPFAKQAMVKKKVFIITHSAIFPGTYASNKETSDYLLQVTGLQRIKVNKSFLWGMHQTSEANEGKFFVFGFAGNSARDHVDHFHALPYFFKFLADKL